MRKLYCDPDGHCDVCQCDKATLSYEEAPANVSFGICKDCADRLMEGE